MSGTPGITVSGNTLKMESAGPEEDKQQRQQRLEVRLSVTWKDTPKESVTESDKGRSGYN